MKISIAVPSYNYGVYLEACLQSIAAQEQADFEVLIADGGSTDNSLQIAQRLAARDARFRIVSTADRGQAHAVQVAFEQAAGDVFGFLNADDLYLRSDALAQVAASISGNSSVDVVSFGGYYVDENGRVIKRIRLRYHPLDSLARLRFRPSVLQPGTFWRRRVQQAIPFHEEYSYVFDAVFFYEASQRFKWLEFDSPIVGYRLHGRNKSMGVKADRVRELAQFEAMKFGPQSMRARYLSGVAALVERLDSFRPLRALQRVVYLVVNSLGFVTAYRLPGI